MLTSVNADGSTENGSLIDEIIREGARWMLVAASEAEVNSYLLELADVRDEAAGRLAVRNNFHRPQQIATSAGAVEVRALRVSSRPWSSSSVRRPGSRRRRSAG